MPIYLGGDNARHYSICRCRQFQFPDTWKDNDLWTHRYDGPIAPVPTACVGCGGWDKCWDRTCSRCGSRYYRYFLHPGQQYYPNDLCWPCCQINDVREYQFWGGDTYRLAPNPALFPPRRSLAEIREAMKKI